MYDIDLILEKIAKATAQYNAGTLNKLDYILAVQITAEEMDLVYKYKALISK